MNTPRHVVHTHLRSTLINSVTAVEDAIHLHKGSVRRCFIKPIPNIPLSAGHMDGVQVIPDIGLSPYALPYLDSFEVTQTVVDGENTPIQCCFASDGVFGFAHIADNTFRTDGAHLITLNGLLSGRIVGNTFESGEQYPIKLYPARPGGNPDGAFNIWVLHFKGDRFKYQPIECDIPELMQDYRQTVFNSTDKFLINFDYDKFESLAAQVPNAGGRVMGREFQRIALLCGDLVTEYSPVGVSNMYELTKAGRDLLIESEGIELSVYQDINGNDTIGIGHLVTDQEKLSGVVSIGGTDVGIYDTKLTEQQVYRLFAQDIAVRVEQLNTLLSDAKVKLTQDQFDALFSFYYNLGYGNFTGSSAWEAIKKGELHKVPAAIRLWNKSRGKYHAGMAARRERTVALWESLGWLPSPTAANPNSPLVSEDTEMETLLLRMAQHPKLVPFPNVTSYLRNTKASAEDRMAWAQENIPEVWGEVTMVDDSVTPPSAPDFSTPSAPAVAPVAEVHETKLQSTTLQGIVGMAVSSVAAFAVAKLGLPETITTMVQPVIVEALLGLAAGFFGGRAWSGRINAVKGFKE